MLPSGHSASYPPPNDGILTKNDYRRVLMNVPCAKKSSIAAASAAAAAAVPVLPMFLLPLVTSPRTKNTFVTANHDNRTTWLLPLAPLLRSYTYCWCSCY